MAIGKTAPNGTLNADGAFYSVQDVNVLLENAGGGGGGADLPTPTVADAGSVVVVDAEGKYALGEAGGDSDIKEYNVTISDECAVNTGGGHVYGVTINKEDESFPWEITIENGVEKALIFLGYKTEPASPQIVMTNTGSPVQFIVTGGVVDDGDGFFIVSGDGTITIQDA